jgi:capsular exopolysaccharide synthesis family protein
MGKLLPSPGAIAVIPPDEADLDERSLPISHYLWVLKRSRLRILLFVLACVFSTYLVSRRITPVYEAITTIDVDRQMPHGTMGDSTAESAIASPIDADQFLATQSGLIKSDSVLRPVVEKLGLKEKEPSYGETVKTAEKQDAPIFLKGLDVIRPPNTYLLLVKYRSSNPRLAADVTNAVADSYLEHSWRIRIDSSEKLGNYMSDQLDQLKAKMEGSSQRLADFERELKVINPDQKTSIQSANLMQLNADYNAAKADRVMKEAAWNAIRPGSLSAAYASSQGDSLKKLSETLSDARQKFAQIKSRYGEGHPEYLRAQAQVTDLQQQLGETRAGIAERVEVEYKQALDRENMLAGQVEETRSEFDRLNARSFNYQALKEEADADRKLYDELIRKIREATINSTFQDSSVRIADRARVPANPVFPRIKLNLLIAFLISSLLGFGAAITGDLLDDTIRDPEEVARSLRTEVVGSLPTVRSLRSRMNTLAASPETSLELVPAGFGDTSMSGYEEAIRTLRNSILLTDFDRHIRSVLVTSASPSEGKSTVAAHLATTHAQHHRKTLLIDADLRRPSAHRFFTISSEKGLSTVLSNWPSWREVIQPVGASGDLHVMPAGPASRRAADLIGQALPEIIEEASREYDMVILDSPPLIGFPEPLEMAANVDGVLVVTKAGHTSRKAVASVMTTLNRLRARPLGIVLNEVTKEMSASYYYHGYYTRYYRQDKEPDTRVA